MIAATPLQSALRDVEEMAEEIRREQHRRYTFYRMLHATDDALWWLEELNLREVKRMPAGLGKRIREHLAELPTVALGVLTGGTVQQVMDGVYLAQEALFRWRDPARECDGDGETAEAPDFTAADLERWAGVCEWLRGFEPAGLLRRDAGLRSADLEAMQDRGLVYLRDGSRWRVYTTWVRRLDALRARVEVG